MRKIKKFCAWLVLRDIATRSIWVSVIVALIVVPLWQKFGMLTPHQVSVIMLCWAIFALCLIVVSFIGAFNFDMLDEYLIERAHHIAEERPEFAASLDFLSHGHPDYLREWLKKYDSVKYEELSEKMDSLRKSLADAPGELQEVEASLRKAKSDLMSP